MPFTFAHPAAIFPLTLLPKRWYSLSGLVAGSIAPDMEYFFRMRVLSTHSHIVAGLFYFNLPIGLLISFLFHWYVRDPLLYNLPPAVRLRLIPASRFNWIACFKRTWIIVLLSVFIGAASHLLWDSFTHPTGYFVTRIPLLQYMLHCASFSFPLYKWLQHTSTVIGTAAIAAVILHLPKHSQQVNIYKRYWARFIPCFLVILALRLLVAHAPISMGDAVVAVISSAMFTSVLVGASYKVQSGRLYT